MIPAEVRGWVLFWSDTQLVPMNETFRLHAEAFHPAFERHLCRATLFIGERA